MDEAGAFTGDPNDLLLLDQAQADAEFYGAEAETKFALISGGPFSLNTRLFGDMVRGKLVGAGNLPRITPARLGLGLDATYGPLDMSMEAVRAATQDRVAALERASEGYTLLSADFGYSLWLGTRKLTTYVRGRNLLDEEVRPHTSFLKDFAPQPGRAVFLGFRMDL